MVAESMIEEVTLPVHAAFSCHIFFPVLDRRAHSRLARERKDGVQMIRHEQTEAAMPNVLLVIILHCRQYGIAGVGVA